MTDLQQLDPVQQISRRVGMSEATKIEVSRAVAEVQAQVLVAQNVPRPRDDELEAEMIRVCRRYVFARRAFYSVPNRGSGPSIHLAQELARIFGNVDYGVRELRRDDLNHESEVLAHAVDWEKNTRSTRSMIIPHRVMGKDKQQRPIQNLIIDLTDIYRNNQNIGARAVRECIFTIIPSWLRDLAEDVCRQTLEEAANDPAKVGAMLAEYKRAGITVADLEGRVDRKRANWTGQDMAELAVLLTSLTRHEVTREEAFPAQAITREEIMQTQTAEEPPAFTLGPTQMEPVGPEHATDPRAAESRSNGSDTGPATSASSEPATQAAAQPATGEQQTEPKLSNKIPEEKLEQFQRHDGGGTTPPEGSMLAVKQKNRDAIHEGKMAGLTSGGAWRVDTGEQTKVVRPENVEWWEPRKPPEMHQP